MRKIEFTDGSFIIALSSDSILPEYIETTYACPNLLVLYEHGLYQATPFEITKTDKSGTIWKFKRTTTHFSVTIGDQTAEIEIPSSYATNLAYITVEAYLGTYLPSVSVFSYLPNNFPNEDENGNGTFIDGYGASGTIGAYAAAHGNHICFNVISSANTFKSCTYLINWVGAGEIQNLNPDPYDRISNERIGDSVLGSNVVEDFDPEAPIDPYDGAGDSSIGGGDGTFDGSSDPVPVPPLPSIGATDTGFISLFVPSQAQLKQVASYLWSSFFDIATFKKIFEDPMDCILGLSVVPVSVPTSGNAQITVGNVELSGITLPLASQQYVEIDCGTIDFTRRYFGSYLDFEPYTKMSLFVPYSGVHSISADDIIGKVVGLKYHIDILTGSLVAFLTCGNSVLYEFNGACASNIPVNSMNYASTIENAIRIAVNIGTTVATAGAAAPATGAAETGKMAVGGAGIGRGIAIAGSTAEGALSLKPSIDRAGSLGGTTGLMGNQIPYFIITRPRMCKPKNQDFFQGYPSFIQTTLGAMDGTGFTAFENVVISKTYLTEEEKSELTAILNAGVYL